MARVRRVVLVALAWSVVRADDYGSASMPQYGDSAEYPAAALAPLPGSALDYRGHSPDAPAPLDYKYEEEPQGNTEKSTKHTIELPDSWKRPARKQRGLKRDRDEPSDGDSDGGGGGGGGGGGVDADPLPKLQPSRRRHLHRARLADDKSLAEEDPAPRRPRRRRPRRRGRVRDDYSQPEDYKGDYRVDNNKVLDEDVDAFTLGEPTETNIQRKPRDRLLSKFGKPRKSDLDSDEELLSDRKMARERFGERERYRPVLRQPPPLLREEEEEDEEGGGVAERPRPRHKPSDYHDYNDNYDVRRLHNINDKMPKLLRRTTTRSPLPGGLSASTVDLLSQLWTAARRALPADDGGGAGAGAAPPTSAETTRPDPPEETTLSAAARARARASTPSAPTNSAETIPIGTTTESTSILSFAEKSRLSILKKSQKKENEKGEVSKKPPVLLQVTSKMATIVMVEPHTSADPWLRARHSVEESPQKLEKVKRLMRHKLVAGAKSIQELTNNWDDMVCDYIDVSLLDMAVLHKMPLPLLCVTLAFVLVIR